MIFIVTGPIHSGKTTGLSSIVSTLTERGRHCAGILSRAVFHNGKRIGYDLIDIATDKMTPLIRLEGRELWPTEAQLRFGKYSFSLSAFQDGNQILENITHPDVIIIDEIGHLELRGQGFAPGLRSVLGRHSCPIVPVVRESLLSDVVSCFGIRSYKPFSVTDGAFLTQLLATTDL